MDPRIDGSEYDSTDLDNRGANDLVKAREVIDPETNI